ncbi:hypothetical protein ACLB2K_012512 [Fragaria x ananassa]
MVPAGLISGFGVKFGAGPDSWYQSSRFHLLFSIHYRICLSSHSVYSVDPQKVEAVSNWKRPTTVTEIRSFLGLADDSGEYVVFCDASRRGLLVAQRLQRGWSVSRCHGCSDRRLGSPASCESNKRDRETERHERFEPCGGDSKQVEIWNQQNGRPLWWHAHVSWLRATVYGALIIHPRSPRSYPFPAPF